MSLNYLVSFYIRNFLFKSLLINWLAGFYRTIFLVSLTNSFTL